jgi:hypothetical protein
MRYLKRQNLNRRVPNDTTLYSDPSNTNVFVYPLNQGALAVPTGASVPSSAVDGMIRYNSSTGQFQGRQAGVWRNFRFKEPTLITQQNLGAGDSNTVYFGPVTPIPGTASSEISSWNTTQIAKNIFVYVENVFQIAGQNYTIVQNPTVGADSYVGTTSTVTSLGATTMYFNTALVSTGASANAGTVTVTFSTRDAAPFAVGSNILITGFNPTSYNGIYEVTECTTSYVRFVGTGTGTVKSPGAVTAWNPLTNSSAALFPAATFSGSTVTGTGNLFNPTSVSSFATDPDTDALISITLSHATVNNNIPENTTITIGQASQLALGYYILFSSPPPYGKIVTALIGFDQ